jgi:D-arabinose 1-dehydrogenase-like Zn-dependent alcohol dehydrogenase
VSGEVRAVVHARTPGDDRPGHLRAVGRPAPEAGPGEALVEVHAALLDPTAPPPAGDGTVVGTAGAGVVVAVGSSVAGLLPGDGVALPASLPCGRCPVCRAGRSNLCADARRPGVDSDGWLADRVVVPAHLSVSRPATIPAALAATVAGPVATAFNAVKRAGVGPGLRVGVVGAGGLGSHLVQLAALAGGEVVALDEREDARERAQDLGADEALPRDGRPLLEAFGDPVDRLLVSAEVAVDLDDAVASLHPGGRLTLVDLPGLGEAELPVADLVARELDVVGATGVTLHDVVELFDLAAEGRLILAAALGGQHTVDDLRAAEAALEATTDGRPLAVDPRPGT